MQHSHSHASSPPENPLDFVVNMFDAEFMPRAECMLQRPDIIWMHIVADAMIALAYFSIPLALFYFVRKRRDLAFHWIFVLFGVFILACGTTHVMNVLAIWKPMYRLDGVIKVITALASVGTAAVLWPLIPKAIMLPRPAELRAANVALEAEVAARRTAEEELRKTNIELESRVADRTRALSDSEQRYRAIFNQAAVGITQVSLTGQWLFVNDPICRMLGYARERLVGSPVEAFCHPEDRAGLAGVLRQMASGEVESTTVEQRLLRADAQPLWAAMTHSIVRDANGKPAYWIAIIQDITQRKAFELELAKHREQLEGTVRERTAELERSHQRLRVSERMASIGTLSAGLGHDMGNLLFPLRVRLESMRQRELPSGLDEELKAIESTCDYLAQLSRGLKQLAIDPDNRHGSGGESQHVSIADTWGQIVGLVKSTLPRQAELSVKIADGLPRVHMSMPALTQILVNLVQNAGDAVRERERGTIAVVAERAAEPGWVRLSVSDDGVGMTQAVLERCLEPFFSTKTRTMSTGLGLALVQGLVQRAGGRMDIASTQGEGTTFTMLIPSAEPVGHDSSDRRRALIRVADARVAQFVAAVCRSGGFEPVLDSAAGEQSAEGAHDQGRTHLLAVDASPEGLREARAFVDADPRRRAMLFGPLPEGFADGRYVHLADGFKPVRIADAVRRAVSEVQSTMGSGEASA